jgi:BirA family biotin operon repressor/biotin-[acetyl-CoA-carboxylase] ligase
LKSSPRRPPGPDFESLAERFGEPLDPRETAGVLGISVADLADARSRGRGDGFWIEECPGGTLRLENRPMTPVRIPGLARWTVETLRETDSTNARLLARAEAGGLSPGAVLCAERQAAGRGRFGRSWECPPFAGLLFSAFVRLPDDPAAGAVLTATAAASAARAIREAFPVPVELRWPNDLVVRGRKIGGVLAETCRASGPGSFVVGLGVNTHVRAGEFPPGLETPATSIAMETDRPCDRNALLAGVLRALGERLDALSHGAFEAVENEWKALSGMVGSRVRLLIGDSDVEGRVEDLSIRDGLILRRDDGGIGIFPAEEALRLRPLGDPGETASRERGSGA